MYHLIVNPDAGKHKTLRAARSVADYFDEREEEYVIEICHICKIGTDLILVEVNKERVTNKCGS